MLILILKSDRTIIMKLLSLFKFPVIFEDTLELEYIIMQKFDLL